LRVANLCPNQSIRGWKGTTEALRRSGKIDLAWRSTRRLCVGFCGTIVGTCVGNELGNSPCADIVLCHNWPLELATAHSINTLWLCFAHSDHLDRWPLLCAACRANNRARLLHLIKEPSEGNIMWHLASVSD